MAGDQNHFAFGLQVFGFLQNIHAIDVVHHQIRDDDIVSVLLEQLRPVWAGAGAGAVQPETLNAFVHRAHMVLVVVDQEDSNRGQIGSVFTVVFAGFCHSVMIAKKSSVE